MAKATFGIKLDVSGLQGHIKNYRARVMEAVDDAMREDHFETAKKFRGFQYPPPPPNSTYTRTGKLGYSWNHKRYKKTRAIVEWGIENKASQRGRAYPTYVVGDDQGRQAWMHKGRWWVALNRYTETLNDRVENIRRALVKLWRQTG